MINSSRPGSSIASDGYYVYWQSVTGDILRCGINGCLGAPPAKVVRAPRPTIFSLDGADVVWNDGQKLMRCAKSGCTNATVLASVPAPVGLIEVFALTPTAIYFHVPVPTSRIYRVVR